MKQYLVKGAAVLAIGSAFVGCTKEKDLYDPAVNAQQIIENYNKLFIETFGQPAANQNWGFGAAAGARVTRANPGETYDATSEGINANANEWADPDKQYGGWIVPDALTPGQKERVRAYFQANPDRTYEDPHFRHFFVQQVYKGGTAQAGVSTENITAADKSVYNSDNMNLLTVGENHQHINNFNKGTATTVNVLNNGQHVGGTSHSDEIMLMVNIDDTSCFGYHETGSSTHHDDKAALVSAATIDAWAAENGYPGDAVVDEWNRSFLGFDLAIQEGKQAYAKDEAGNVIYATYDQAPESPSVAWDGEKVFPIKESEVIVHSEWWTEVKYGDYLEDYKTIQNIGWLTTNENFYVAADKVTLSQTYQNGETQASSLIDVKDAVVIKDLVYEGTKYQAVLNLVKINNLVADGYLPVKDKSLTEWVKVGKSDGYFSDWIVTLTEAKRQSTGGNPGGGGSIPSEKPSLRVMAEDLSATEASDFDFNDVVFEVKYVDENTVNIEVLAAGGTLPLRLCENDEWEVHKLFNVATTCMVNTCGDSYTPKDPWSKADGKTTTPATLVLTGKTWSDNQDDFAAQVNTNIKVEVYKEDGWRELTAPLGKPACKVATSTTYTQSGWYGSAQKWAWERQNLGEAFSNWVTNPNMVWGK